MRTRTPLLLAAPVAICIAACIAAVGVTGGVHISLQVERAELGSTVQTAHIPEPVTSLRSMVHTTIQVTALKQKAKCSATAIGPRALLTASHCEQPEDRIFVDGTEMAISSIHRDGRDHTIYLLAGGKPFPDYVSLDRVATPVEGEEAAIVGSPESEDKLYRTGVYSGWGTSSELRGFEMFSFAISHGDSGSAIFNSDHKLIGVVSIMTNLGSEKEYPLIFACALPLGFTPAQWNLAEHWIGS